MHDDILDWPVSADFHPDGTGIVCEFVTITKHPDRRCKGGVRMMRSWCGDSLEGLSLRELYASAEAHAREAHNWEGAPGGEPGHLGTS